MAITPHIFHTHDAMGAALGDRIIQLVQEKPNAVIGLATGSTPEPVYARIVERAKQAAAEGHPIDFSKATFFALDEYVGLQRDDPQSYYRYLHEKLFDHINAREENIHIPNGAAADPEKAARDYEAEIMKAGKVDLWIVGLGANGHVAFNEPGTSFDSRTHVVQLTDDTLEKNSRNFEGDVSRMPTHAITVGLGTLREHASHIAFVVNGGAKQEILSTVLHGKEDTQVPATMLQRLQVSGYFDRAAMGGATRS